MSGMLVSDLPGPALDVVLQSLAAAPTAFAALACTCHAHRCLCAEHSQTVYAVAAKIASPKHRVVSFTQQTFSDGSSKGALMMDAQWTPRGCMLMQGMLRRRDIPLATIWHSVLLESLHSFMATKHVIVDKLHSAKDVKLYVSYRVYGRISAQLVVDSPLSREQVLRDVQATVPTCTEVICTLK